MTAGRFAGKTALITGAGQGIGRATALRMAAEGASVVLADRADIVLETAEAIGASGGSAHPVLVDLEGLEGSETLYAEIQRLHSRLDIAVHNVGGTIWTKPFVEYTPSEIQAEIQRSLWPTIWGCHFAARLMKAQGGGVIVNVGSIATRGINRVPYAAAKGGVAAATATLAEELARSGVRVNDVAPGGVEGEPRKVPRNPDPVSEAETVWFQEVISQTLRDTPLGRFGTPEEIAAVICFIASDDASYLTGQTIYAGGGAIG